jgi:hypothetical protein
MNRTAANWLLSLATVALLVLFLGAAELILRLVNPDYLHELYAEESSNVYSETYGWRPRAGFKGMDDGRRTTINRRGYRGTEHPYERSPGRRRVVVVGDSISFGEGVDDWRTFSALLEARDPSLEIVNLSVGGYGTDQELIMLEQEGLRYQPDVVILGFCLFSDFTDNTLPTALFDARQPKPYFTWDGGALVKHDDHVRLSLPRKVAQWLFDRSFLYNRVRALLGLTRPPREPGVWANRVAAVMQNLPPAADVTFRLIRRMHDLSRQAGARFLVLIHPDRFAYQHRSRLLRQFCLTPLLGDVTVVDLGARYHAAGLTFDSFAGDEPGHLTERGHEVTAGVLETLLSGPTPADWDYRSTCRAAFTP